MKVESHRLRKAIGVDAKIIVLWFPTHENAILWGGPDVPENLDAVWLAKQFDDPIRDYLVLVDDTERVCGICSLRPFAEKRRLHIGHFAVAPELRGQGLGSLMIEHAMRIARAADAERLTLFVYDRNASAKRLYERLGFVVGAGLAESRADAMNLMECCL